MQCISLTLSLLRLARPRPARTRSYTIVLAQGKLPAPQRTTWLTCSQYGRREKRTRSFGYLHGNKTDTETDVKNSMQTEPTDSLLSSSGASGLVAFTSNKQKGGKKQERERERGQRCEACHTQHNQRLTDEDSRETLL